MVFLSNAGINKLANARSDVTIQRGKTRFGINKEHPSDLDSANFTKTFPFIKLVYHYVINFIRVDIKICYPERVRCPEDIWKIAFLEREKTKHHGPTTHFVVYCMSPTTK